MVVVRAIILGCNSMRRQTNLKVAMVWDMIEALKLWGGEDESEKGASKREGEKNRNEEREKEEREMRIGKKL